MSLMMKAFHAVTILKNSTTIHWVTFYKSQKINVCTVISQDPLHALVLGIFNSRHTQYWFLYYNLNWCSRSHKSISITFLKFLSYLQSCWPSTRKKRRFGKRTIQQTLSGLPIRWCQNRRPQQREWTIPGTPYCLMLQSSSNCNTST